MTALTLKQLIFRILGKHPEAVVVSFATGDRELAERMFAEIQRLEPAREHILVRPEEFGAASTLAILSRLRQRFRKNRIGLAPVLLGDPRYRALRRAAFLLAPRKILAYNQRLERHHLRPGTAIASWLFLRGVPLDRIFLRPKWLAPWKRDRSVYPTEVQEIEGRPLSARRRRIAVVSPYFPYPLSHGGAVRIFCLLREMAEEFDIFLFAFLDQETPDDFQPVREHCARVTLVRKARYREPRWSTLDPPEVHEFRSPAMLAALERIRREHKLEAVQVEYTMLAPYRGDVLIEHDVTFDLYRQVRRRSGTLAARWDYWRWRRFERKWIARYRKVVAMSDRDAALLDRPNVTVIPNGVDLARFRPEIERPGSRLLFIGSFRHFPNIVAYRFLMEQVWPILHARAPDDSATVVAGPDPLLYWREHTGLLEIPGDERVALLGFVPDVQPLYVEANLVLVPTLVSAGTNLKVLEALAMQRAVVSTSSGCAGLGLEHAVNVWIADSADDFAKGVETLLRNRDLRERIAARGREHAERHFDWKAIGARQRAMLAGLLPPRFQMRPAQATDIPELAAIQATAPEASQWHPGDYLAFDCQVAMLEGRIAGFVVSRRVSDREREILNVAVHPDHRRLGIATELLRLEMARWLGAHFLEVRESNTPARRLYEQLGFEIAGTRPGYYENPPETGIVMRIFS
ncbi:MAG: GNAT family N-acetyltransferase [Acidobacteriia bacterium]|nr:GNAT family N-acetyltransferase [Terriglobia bacterium]